MSTLANDRFAENLFDRLERLEPSMSLPEYGRKQSKLLRLLSTGQFEEAEELVIEWERERFTDKYDVKSEIKQDMEYV